MGSPPQLPTGYKLDDIQSGPPTPPKGYTIDSLAPAAPPPPSQFEQDRAITDAWAQGHPILGPMARFLVAGGQNAANAITQTPGFVYHSIVDPPAIGESVLPREQLIAGRLLGLPQAAQAASEYTPDTLKAIPSVLPEALGTGLGTVAGTAPYARLSQVRGAAQDLNRIVPTKTRGGAGLGLLEDWYAKHPIDTNRFLAETTKMEGQLSSTREKLPPPIAGLQKTIATANANAARGLPGFEFDFKAARDALKRLNDHIDFRNPTPANKFYMRAASALSEDIMESTGKPSQVAPQGFQADYARMIDEVRRANKAIRVGENLGPYAGAFAGYELGHELGAPIGAEYALGYLGRQVAKPIAGALMRSVLAREGGPPNIGQPVMGPMPAPPGFVTPPPAPPGAPPPVSAAPMGGPPPVPPAAPTANMPTAASRAASNAAFAHNFPEANMPEDWGVDTTPAAKPIDTEAFARAWEPAKQQLRQELGREPTQKEIAARRDQLAGGRPSGDVGQQSRQANPEPTRAQTKGKGKQPPAPPQPPKPLARNLPPEAALRFILEAKNGDISPGELARRYTKYGLDGRTRPLDRG